MFKIFYLWMNDWIPSSLNPWMSSETILFGRERNHLLDWRWLKVWGRDVTMTWQFNNKEPLELKSNSDSVWNNVKCILVINFLYCFPLIFIWQEPILILTQKCRSFNNLFVIHLSVLEESDFNFISIIIKLCKNFHEITAKKVNKNLSEDIEQTLEAEEPKWSLPFRAIRVFPDVRPEDGSWPEFRHRGPRRGRPRGRGRDLNHFIKTII